MAAEATTAQTLHMNGVPIDTGPAFCMPGDVWITGNAVMHGTVNNAGGVWVTATIEGPAVDPAAGFTGRATLWFGCDQNNMNAVNSFTADAQDMLSDGTPVRFHAEGQMTINAQGALVVNRTPVTCS